jgi:hypothetical protein
VKLNVVAALVELTDLVDGLGSTTALEEEVTVTFRALPAVIRVTPREPAVGPKFVSQLSASDDGLTAIVAAA